MYIVFTGLTCDNDDDDDDDDDDDADNDNISRALIGLRCESFQHGIAT